MNRILLFLALVAGLLLTSLSAQQPTPAPAVPQTVSPPVSTGPALPDPTLPPIEMPLSTQQPPAWQQADGRWGMTLLPIPSYMQVAGYTLQLDQGWLITSVVPGSPAQLSGLRSGQTLLEVDGAPCLANQVIPRLDCERRALVMCESGLREIVVNPNVTQPNWNRSPRQTLRSLLLGMAMPPMIEPDPWLQSQSPVHSLAVSEVNGVTQIVGVVEEQGRPVRVEMCGTEAEIARQLDGFSPSVQHALRLHLGW